MAAVMIGVDPQKGHTLRRRWPAEMALGQLRVRATGVQVQWLLALGAGLAGADLGGGGAGGLGYLLARQLPAAGERVLDVQPKLAARVRLLAAGEV